MTEKLQELRELLGQYSDLDAISSVLGWDQQAYMPPGGAPARAHQLATVNRMAHEIFVSDRFSAALEGARSEIGDFDPDSDEVRLVQEISRRHEKACKVPSDWVAEFNRLSSLAYQEWEQAKQDSEFARFAPHLAKLVEMRRDYAEFFAPYDHVYDPLLDDFEPGMKSDEVRKVFEDLRPKQVELVKAIVERGKPVDDSVVRQAYDEQKQWDFGIEIIKKFGYDFDRGRQDKTAHPFTTAFSINDVRITTRIKPKFLPSALFSSMHEAGHALYGQGVSQSLERTPLIGGASLGIHESQSRMWENLVGRSRAFWKGAYGRLQEFFPAQLGDVDVETFYRAINKVEPSLIRTDADEATYNLHIMMRFNIEISLMQGDLQVDDLPQVWNQKMQEYLGVTPPDDAHGVLQDVHWSYGIFGYFPTYALGNLVAARLWQKIGEEIPDLEAQIEQGKFGNLLDWLRENVHQHGAKFKPMELLERITGSGLNAEPYVAYLQTKFGEIYEL
ncbi:MAG: carboxypeptidase M32 [Anaerolineales bacterium]